MRIYSGEYNRLFIDKAALLENYKKIRKFAGGEFISVVKANAYGLGVKHLAKTLFVAGQNTFAVANLKEGIYLRRLLGSTPQIYILGAVDIRDVYLANKFKLIIPIISKEFFESVKSAKTKPELVYLQVDTGMNRLGLKCGKNAVNQVIDYLDNDNQIKFLGVFSHFAKGENESISREQIKLLGGINIKALSFSASDASAKDYPLKEIKRIGLALFGYGVLAEKLQLKSVVSLRSRVVRIAYAKKGERVGYNRYFLDRDCSLATVPLGYADGLKRSYVGQSVRINKREYKIISICMDMAIIKADKGVKVGDSVVIFDSDLKIERLAKADNTIVYECLTSLGNRIYRKVK